MAKKKGFTLIELIIVVIIIGVLAAVAIPQYMRAVERAKGSKAMHALGLLTQAEKMYRAVEDSYVTTTDPGNNQLLLDHVELGAIADDTDWTYGVTAFGTGENMNFTAVATRRAGPYDDTVISFNIDGYQALSPATTFPLAP